MSYNSISFVIPSRWNEDFLPKSLYSIIRDVESTKYDCEIILVVDDKQKLSEDVKTLAEHYPYLKIHEIKGNRCVAKNYGTELSTKQIVTYIDADTVVDKGLTENTIGHFNRGFGFVNYSSRAIGEKRRLRYYAKFMNLWQWTFTKCNIDMPYGFAMSVRRDILDATRLEGEYFDVSLPGFGEDAEIGRRVGRYCRQYHIRGFYEARSKAHTLFREWDDSGFWGMSSRLLRNCFHPYMQ